MYIDTTININIKLLDELHAASKQLKLSRSDLVILLLQRVVAEKKLPVFMFKQVRYQPRNFASNWKKIHVYPEVEAYEQWLDARKFLKWSVSALIAFAIQEYLEILLEELSGTGKPKNSDNYPTDYFFLARDAHGTQKFVIYWGYPGDEELGSCFT
ncbi:MAG: hypothetical protein GY754_00930 [bacterium]|nr:hypothetical protein [bacterium]